ncbi:LysM peptidoglycan-binding domain-containing protein [Lacticaseibacillus sp. GG6-2]
MIKKAHLVWLFSAALALSAGAVSVSSNQVDAATTTQSAKYTVKSGDTLSAIASANDTSVANLVNANSIKDQNFILIGQQLKLKAEAAVKTTPVTTPVVANPTATTYTVKSGDTLGAIAKSVNVRVANLVAYNNLSNANVLRVGQVLKLTGTAAAAQTTTQQTTVQQPVQKQAAPVQQQAAPKQAAPVQQQATQKPAYTAPKQAAPVQQQAAQKPAYTAPKQQTATTQQSTQQTQQTTSTTATSAGTFKISFYDPAAMGSSLGYGGVAANLSVFPKGTQLKIAMSNGQVLYRTVNDTGSFAQSNSHQLDVAMPNNAIPSAGILSATVSVVK